MLSSDKLHTVVAHVRSELVSAISQMAAYVELLERTPTLIDDTHARKITSLSMVCQDLTTELNKYSSFFGDVADTVTNTDDVVESLADRFFKCVTRETINTTQAMERFSRSRSTIYRWIKSGKLLAEKQGRRWAIFV